MNCPETRSISEKSAEKIKKVKLTFSQKKSKAKLTCSSTIKRKSTEQFKNLKRGTKQIIPEIL